MRVYAASSKLPLTASVLLFASTTSYAQGQVSWGGGIAALILQIGAVLFLLWVVFSYWIASVFTQRAAARGSLTLLLALTPIAWIVINAERADRKADREMRLSTGAASNLRLHADNYMTTNCATVRRVSGALISAKDGVLFKSQGNRPLQIELPSLEERRAAAIRASKSEAVAHEPDANAQYRYPLYWIQAATPASLRSVGISVVEFEDNYKKTRIRSAPYEWWEKNTKPAQLWEYWDRYTRGSRLSPAADAVLEVVVEEWKATYLFELEDISTRADRENLTGRGRMRLIRRSDNAVVAEYQSLFGFRDVLSPGYGSWWERVSTCPGPEEKYLDQGRWDSVKFFFGEVVKIKAVQMSKGVATN